MNDAWPWLSSRESLACTVNSLSVICPASGAHSKNADRLLHASQQPLPENLAGVLMRRDEIVYAERVRNDMRLRERISDFRSLVQEIMDKIEPAPYERLRQSPRFIQLMADSAPTMITRILTRSRKESRHSRTTTSPHNRAAQEGWLRERKARP
jgi:hypothetical protein